MESRSPTAAAREAPAPTRAGVVLPVTLTLAIQALASMNTVAVAVMMPVASVDIGVPPSYVGIFVSLIYLGATLFAPVSGHAITRFGPIAVSQICLGLCAAGLAAFSMPAVAMAVLGSLALGVGLGPVTPASSHILVRTTPAAMLSMVFSIKQTGVPLGGALAGAIVPLLVVACGWRTAALLAGASSLVLVALLHRFRGRYDRERSRPPGLTWQSALAPLKMVMAHPELRRIAMASFVYSIMQLSLTSYLVTYLIQSLRLSLIDAGLLLAAAQVCGVAGRILWGALTDRYGNPRRVLGLLGFGMTGGALLAAGFSPEWPFAAILGVCGVFGAAALGWNGVFLAEVARIATPAHAGVATGGSLFFTFLGILLGLPAFAGIVELTGSYAAAFVCVATITFACATALCFTRAPR